MVVSSHYKLETSFWGMSATSASAVLLNSPCSHSQYVTSWLDTGPAVLKWFHFCIDKKYMTVPLPDIKITSVKIFGSYSLMIWLCLSADWHGV